MNSSVITLAIGKVRNCMSKNLIILQMQSFVNDIKSACM